MRTITLTELVDAPPAEDPFVYGSRFVVRAGPDGEPHTVALPLTIWDVLHPQEGDHITQSMRHQKEVRYLTSVLEARVADDPGALVLSDTQIHWDTPGLSHHAPDVALIFGVRHRKEQYTSFHLISERVGPELVIEVVSPHCRANDTETKLAEYQAAGVPMYVLIDRANEEDWPTVLGYRLEAGEYQRITLDDHDCLLLPMLNLRLCSHHNRIICYDAETNEEMGDYVAICQALEEETQLRLAAEADAEKAREAAKMAEERAQKADERAAAEAEERHKADDRARAEADERRKADDRARIEAEERRKADEKAREADEKAREADEKAREADEKAREADEKAREADEKAREASEEARLAIAEARQAKGKAESTAEALRRAEDRARAEADTRADLERQIRDLLAKQQEKKDS